ncbi:hypothetical protein M8998_07355 [Sphingobacterium sp. lm-10]|uniref:hypothetical protein n=1 Tax=Sphingobacterium sp. lm-10 TaxID=2944904 RepID=UPI0020221889|nr:hypothetical protein [Sphingobacterium sp. lm-10]MCL7987751.1 hypothetical protein [Sphingobacterium sp. lm-10]
MRKINLMLVAAYMFLAISARGQDASIVVHPDGLKFANGETYMVVESSGTAAEITSAIERSVKTKSNSKNLTVEVLDDAVIIRDFVPGYTKTDRLFGSAYLLDLTYKVLVEVKDGKYRINAPELTIAANQKNDGIVGIVNTGYDFTISMELTESSSAKKSKDVKFFIFNKRGKLVEKSTKEKLEKDLSDIVGLVADQAKKADW